MRRGAWHLRETLVCVQERDVGLLDLLLERDVGLYSKYREVHLAGRSRSFFRIDFMIFSVTWESGGNFHGHRGGVESQFQFLYPLGINHLRSLITLIIRTISSWRNAAAFGE